MRRIIQILRAVIARSLGEPDIARRQPWEIDLLLTVFLGSVLLALGIALAD